MKPRLTYRKSLVALSSAAWITSSFNAQAIDYAFGTGSGLTPFTITASDQARQTGFSWNGSISGQDFGAVYYRDARSDRTFMHFDLSSLAGAAISGEVSLSLTVDDNYGGAINNGQVSTANAAWTFNSGAPGITAIPGATGPNATFATDDIATWTIPGSALQGYVGSPSFHGLVVSADAGSTAHFKSAATLTGTSIGGQVVVLSAADWSEAIFDNGSSTLNITGSNDVSGGNVTIQSGAALAIGGDATMSSGNFSGAINNNGSLSMGSSANQTLSGVLSGTGSLTKSGAGALKLSGNNTYSGGTTVSSGVLTASYDTLGSGDVIIENGGTIQTSGQWVFGGANGWNALSRTVNSVTVKSGGTLHLSESDGFAIGITNLYLNGGSVTGGGGALVEDLGALFLYNGNEQITAGGSTSSTISTRLGLDGNNNMITVDAGSTLNITGVVANCTSWGNDGGFIKEGSGTLNLTGANTYTGSTTVSAGILSVASPFIDDSSSVMIAAGAVLNLNFSGSDTVGSLEIDGSGPLPPGTYNASHPTYGSYFSGTGSLVIPENGYSSWGSIYGLSAGSENDDLDGDGLSNFTEYAFGLIPNNGASANPITSLLVKSTGQFSYQRRDNALTGLTYHIYYSTDLVTWTEDAGASQPEGAPDSNEVETITVTLSNELRSQNHPKLFIRVKAEQAPL